MADVSASLGTSSNHSPSGEGKEMTKHERSILEYFSPDSLGRAPGTASGRQIRNHLGIGAVRFYLTMARLEDYRLVKCMVLRNEVDGWLLGQRWYEITAAGRTALELEKEECP
jgi:hypothetical protein